MDESSTCSSDCDSVVTTCTTSTCSEALKHQNRILHTTIEALKDTHKQLYEAINSVSYFIHSSLLSKQDALLESNKTKLRDNVNKQKGSAEIMTNLTKTLRKALHAHSKIVKRITSGNLIFEEDEVENILADIERSEVHVKNELSAPNSSILEESRDLEETLPDEIINFESEYNDSNQNDPEVQQTFNLLREFKWLQRDTCDKTTQTSETTESLDDTCSVLSEQDFKGDGGTTSMLNNAKETRQGIENSSSVDEYLCEDTLPFSISVKRKASTLEDSGSLYSMESDDCNRTIEQTEMTCNGINGSDNGVNGYDNGVNGLDNGVNGLDNGVNGSNNGVNGSDIRIRKQIKL